MNWRTTLAALALAGGSAVSTPQAQAMEDTFVFMPGVDIGLPTAALPPAGLYLTAGFQYFNIFPKNGSGQGVSVALHDYNGDAQLLFVPQMPEILGATYGAAVVLPFRGLQAVAPGGTFNNVGMENTVISPLNLSWDLRHGFFVALGFNFYPADGSYRAIDPIHVSRNYASFEPNVSLSYVDKDWLLSGHLLYDVNTRNNATQYLSGDVLVFDFTAMRKFGAIRFGVGGSYEQQVSDDRINGVVVPASPANSLGNHGALLGIGPTAAYLVGPATFSGTVLFEPYARNQPQGVRSYLSVSVPLWQPEKPAAIAAKY
jgi:hypothetical protein